LLLLVWVFLLGLLPCAKDLLLLLQMLGSTPGDDTSCKMA
jgi:hypothetical protein